MSSVTPPERASCDCVVDDKVSLAPVVKVVVPIPRAPRKKDGVVDVEMSDPTVS